MTVEKAGKKEVSMKGKNITMIVLIAMVVLFSPVMTHANTAKLTNGVTLFYKTSNTGYIPVVFVHGWGSSSAMWDKVLKMFPKQYKTFAVDLRGFGDSDKPDSGYTFSEMVEDIAEFLDVLKIKKAILIGHSLGGMILQDFAVAHPDRALALILSDNLARNLPPLGLSEVSQKFIDRVTTNEDENRKIFMASLGRYKDASNLAPGDLEKSVEVALKASPAALREMYKVLLTVPQIPKEKYDTIQVPTLIVLATHDVTPFNHFVAMNDGIKSSTIFIVERSGHSPMWEQPERWMEGVLNFLKNQRFKTVDLK
jgi:pimeloyl-ACP methyl ester carboxylesterase